MFNRKKKKAEREARFNEIFKTIETAVNDIQTRAEEALDIKEPGARLFAMMSVKKEIKNLGKGNKKAVKKETEVFSSDAAGVIIGGSILSLFAGVIMGAVVDPWFLLGLPAGVGTIGTAYALENQKDKKGRVLAEKVKPLAKILKNVSRKLDTAIKITKEHQVDEIIKSDKYDELISHFPSLKKNFQEAAEKRLEDQLKEKYLSKEKPQSNGVTLPKSKPKN